MSVLPGARHGRLLFRTYLVLVGGLIATAALLDYGFGRLQGALAPTAHPWIEGALALIERDLAGAPRDDWPALVAELETTLGVPVRILPVDHVVQEGGAAAPTQEIFDAAGRAAYLKMSPVLDAAIQVGPLPDAPAGQPRMLNFVPPLFYASIFVLVGLWLWPLIRDVDLLNRAARDFAADYRQPTSTRAKATTLKDLAASFDEMSARIRSLIQGQKDLTSALSHEIRTPLARIKFAMAVMGSKTAVSDELRSINEDIEEIDRLIGTMLGLARLEHPDTEVNLQLIPAGEWLEQAVRKGSPREGVRIEQRAPAAPVRMDPELMELALSNLVANACRYASGLVEVDLTIAPHRYVLAVDDDGPGIPEAEREAVFKAFMRLDDSRSRGTGGHGLGLAIVARVAARHGGTARAERSRLGGARIAVEWPRGV